MLQKRALIVGAFGGVGQAVLTLLQRSVEGKKISSNYQKIFLFDKRLPHLGIPLSHNMEKLPQAYLENSEQLRALLLENKITQFIDLSSIDTIECAKVCEEEGVDFLCTSIEEWPGQNTIPTDEAILKLLPPHTPAYNKQSHLVGSGANPGIVNALAFAALKEFSQKVKVEPTVEALGVHSILITEVDTTEEIEPKTTSTDIFSMTWSPAHCLEELFEPRAFYIQQGEVCDLKHKPTDRYYRVRCGEEHILGMAVPHEETKTLARAFPDVDIAFVYCIPEKARKVLEKYKDTDQIKSLPTKILRPPYTTQIKGKDRLGVLLCSKTYGEFWLGFDTDVEQGLKLGTNATQLQVAAGVIAGWEQLGDKKGFHFVEQLNTEKYLSTVQGILGNTVSVFDSQAPSLNLLERRV